MNYKPVNGKWDAPCATYLFNPLFVMEGTLTNAVNKIMYGFNSERVPIEFDTIVCSGVSGIVFAVQLAQRMGRKVAIVRKDGDGTHSTNKIEANCFPNEIGKYIIVDDLIDSGKTIDRIVAAMKKHAPRKTKHVATYLYSYNELRRPDKDRKKSSVFA